MLATQVLIKTKKKLFLYFDDSHANETNNNKKMIFSYTVNINENLKKTDEYRNVALNTYNRVTYLDQIKAIMLQKRVAKNFIGMCDLSHI